jgi:outer membrane protein
MFQLIVSTFTHNNHIPVKYKHPIINPLTVALLLIGTAAMAQTEGPAAPMSLKACIEFTLANNPSIPIYTNDIQTANQQKMELLSGYMPQVNGVLGWDDNLKRQVTVIPGAVVGQSEDLQVQFGNQYNINAVVQADQIIYDQTLLSGLKAIKPNMEAAQLKKEKNDDDLIYNTATAYYQVIGLKEKLRLLNENERKFNDLLRIQQLQYDKGILKKVDLDRVKVALNNIRSQKEYAQTGLELAINRLKVSMGMPMDKPLTVADSVVSLQEVALPAASDFQPQNTWELKIQAKNMVLQSINHNRKRAGFAPTLAFYAKYGWQSFGNDFAQSFDNWFDYSAIGLRLTVPIFDGLRKASQIRQSSLAMSNARIGFQITENNLRVADQNANLVLLNAFNSLQNNKENIVLAKDVFDNSSLQYQNGVASLADLLNAEYAYKEAQSNYLDALIGHLVAKVEVEKIKGNLKNYINNL